MDTCGFSLVQLNKLYLNELNIVYLVTLEKNCGYPFGEPPPFLGRVSLFQQHENVGNEFRGFRLKRMPQNKTKF